MALETGFLAEIQVAESLAKDWLVVEVTEMEVETMD